MSNRIESGFDDYASRYVELLRDPIRDCFAPDRRFFFERKMILLRDALRRLGRVPRSLGWLDIGCGQGDLLRLGQQEFAEATGCDPSSRMLEACAGINVRLQRDPTKIPFDDSRFDLVTAVCVYHHVEPAQRATLTGEAVRVLKPGGIFAAIEHNPLNPVTRLIVARTPVDSDAHLLSARSLRRFLSIAGMQPVETRYFLYAPERLYSRFARIEDLLSWLPLGGQYAVIGRKRRH